jgi:cytochrome P450
MDTQHERFDAHARAPESHLRPPTITPPDHPLPFPRSLMAVIRNPIEGWCKAVYEEPVFLEQMPGQLLAFVTDPEAVRSVLQNTGNEFVKSDVDRRLLSPMVGEGVLTAEGKKWRWQRHTTAPLFRHGELLCYVEAMSAAAKRVCDRWRQAGPKSIQNVDQTMIRASFEIIADTMLPHDDGFDIALIERCMADYLAVSTWDIAYALLHVPQWMPFPGKGRSRGAAKTMRAAMSDLVEERRRSGKAHEDLLGRMMAATDPETGEAMPSGQVIDNLLTFLLAGHETTATMLTWTLYLLAKAPEWQERLANEAHAVAGNRDITADDVAQLGLTRQVLNEAARLYPPVPVITRLATKDVELAGKQVPAGALCVIPIYAIHRHTLLWDDPDIFDPPRFSDDLHAERPRCTYMPFGAGPRICMGAAFANIEAVTILATLMRQVRLAETAGLNPVPVARVSLRPKDGMPLEVTCLETGA